MVRRFLSVTSGAAAAGVGKKLAQAPGSIPVLPAIAWRGPQRGYAARPAYAPAGPGTPARPSPADPPLHPNARRCALGTPALGAAPLR